MAVKNTRAEHKRPAKPTLTRRIFLIKHRFQLRFALYPLLFLCLFLGGGALYLYYYIDETLSYFLYLPHCRVDNIWPEVSPAIMNLATVGGSAFLAALAVWVLFAYLRLVKDIKRLESWADGFDPGPAANLMTDSIRDGEVRALAHRLVDAAERFEEWDGNVARLKSEFLAGARALETSSDENLSAGLEELTLKWVALHDEINRVSVDERKS